MVIRALANRGLNRHNPQSLVPEWAIGLASDVWSELPGTSFVSWANSGGIPQGTGYAYRGTDPIPNIVDAYCDPAQWPDKSGTTFYGGGHGDGTCNAVVDFDFRTLLYSLVGQPTPDNAYLPGYPSPSQLYYPSGRPAEGFFLPASILTNPLDAAYIAPALAKVSTHMYGAAVCTGVEVHYTYLTYARFNRSTGAWSGRGVNLGAQLQAMFSNYNSEPLQIYTMGVYDPVTGLIFLTFIPGTDGGGWRDGIIVFDPATETIVSTNEGGPTGSGGFGITIDFCDLKIVGRDLYVFTSTGSGTRTMNQGYICNLDNLATKTGRNMLSEPVTRSFVLTGDTQGGIYTSTSDKDSIPSFYDGTSIWRWNFPTNTYKVYRVNLTPVSGAGTIASPYVLQQTERSIGGSMPAPGGVAVKYVYSRLNFYPDANVAMVIPRGSSNWFALKLSPP